MKSKLTSAAIAAAIFASSAPVTAQESGAPDARAKGPKASEAAKDPKADQPAKGPKADAPAKGRKAGTAGKETDEDRPAKREDDESARKARARRDREERDKKDAEEAGEAVGRATTTAATAVVDTAQDVTRALDEPGKYHPLAVTLNPLGLVVGSRVSVNVEYAPVTHHVLIASPHFASPSEEVAVSPDVRSTNRFTGVGGEIGYRYYTGQRGMNGIFLGPSLIAGVYNASFVGGDTGFTNIGVAADIGVQTVVWDHVALGAGLGLQYLSVSQDFGDLSTGPSTIASSGLKPRLLAQAGYAF